MNVALYILVAGLVLLFSHFFDEISQKLKVPSVAHAVTATAAVKTAATAAAAITAAELWLQQQ